MVWVSSPGQYSPPKYGAGLVHVLVRMWVMSPVHPAIPVVHLTRRPHSDHAPFATTLLVINVEYHASKTNILKCNVFSIIK